MFTVKLMLCLSAYLTNAQGTAFIRAANQEGMVVHWYGEGVTKHSGCAATVYRDMANTISPERITFSDSERMTTERARDYIKAWKGQL